MCVSVCIDYCQILFDRYKSGTKHVFKVYWLKKSIYKVGKSKTKTGITYHIKKSLYFTV